MKRLAALLVAASAAAGPVVLAGSAAADTASFDGSFNLGSAAHGFSVMFGNPSGQPYPVAAIQIPETQSGLNTGPSSYALSSILWPGPLAANAGSLLGLVLPACSPPTVALPVPGVAPITLPVQQCTPTPKQIQEAGVPLSYGNYPVRAEAAFPGGKESDVLGPLSSKASGDNAEGSAAIADYGPVSIVNAARMIVHSRSFLDNGKLTSIGESVITGLNIAGGTITVDTLKTVATATTDGKTATASHVVTIQGLSVQGHPATVDQNGVHFNGGDSNPLTSPEDNANTVLKNLNNLKVWLTKPITEKSTDGSASTSTGVLAITWPFDPGGNGIVLTIGGADARAQASPAIDLSQFDSIGDVGDISASIGSDTPSAFDAGSSSVLGSDVALPTANVPLAGAPVASTGRGSNAAPTVALGESRAGFSRRVPAGPWVLALVFIVGLAALLQRAQAAAAAAAAADRTPCPNDRRTTG